MMTLMRRLKLPLIIQLLDTIRISKAQLSSIKERLFFKRTFRWSRNSIPKQKKQKANSSLVSTSYQIGLLKKSLLFSDKRHSLKGLIREIPHTLLLRKDSFNLLINQLIGEIAKQFLTFKISWHVEVAMLLQLLVHQKELIKLRLVLQQNSQSSNWLTVLQIAYIITKVAMEATLRIHSTILRLTSSCLHLSIVIQGKKI